MAKWEPCWVPSTGIGTYPPKPPPLVEPQRSPPGLRFFCRKIIAKQHYSKAGHRRNLFSYGDPALRLLVRPLSCGQVIAAGGSPLRSCAPPHDCTWPAGRHADARTRVARPEYARRFVILEHEQSGGLRRRSVLECQDRVWRNPDPAHAAYTGNAPLNHGFIDCGQGSRRGRCNRLGTPQTARVRPPTTGA